MYKDDMVKDSQDRELEAEVLSINKKITTIDTQLKTATGTQKQTLESQKKQLEEERRIAKMSISRLQETKELRDTCFDALAKKYNDPEIAIALKK